MYTPMAVLMLYCVRICSDPKPKGRIKGRGEVLVFGVRTRYGEARRPAVHWLAEDIEAALERGFINQGTVIA